MDNDLNKLLKDKKLRHNWKINLYGIAICAIIVFSLAGCHKHQYSTATCETPKTCESCGKTKGKRLQHTYDDATCDSPKICTKCGESKGEPLDHDFSNATCETAKTCELCGKISGKPNGHTWNGATCISLKTCDTCEKTEGDYADHTWNAATCQNPKTCAICGESTGNIAGHSWSVATFEEPKTCVHCGTTEGKPLSVSDFEKKLKEMPVYVQSTEYIVQDDEYKSLYPDMFSAIVKNNSGGPVKNLVVAFVAWDVNNFPIKIYGEYDWTGNYVKKCDYGDVNMKQGATYGKDKGMAINYDEMGKVGTFKAIVYEYTDFEGKTWRNPYYETWLELYEDKILE